MCEGYSHHARSLARMPATTLGRVAASNEGARVWLDQRETATERSGD